MLAYLGGVLTIFSPCVLPVIPFIFSRSDQSFRRSGLPTLFGMALSFAVFGMLSVAGGKWVIQANQYGRTIALAVFTILGLSLLFERFGDRLMGSFVKWGGTLQKKAEQRTGIGSSLLLGASLGLLWAPCAGPILGLILAGASLGKSNEQTLVLLFSFALGAATSLGVAIFASGRLLAKLKRNLGAERYIKRGLGAFVLLAVLAIALGLDTKLLASFSFLNTNGIEKALVDKISPQIEVSHERKMPSLSGATHWLNSESITSESLRGKVVLIDFWTYSCINCLRALPYVSAWAEKYTNKGLLVLGVHTPEFAFERDLENVKKAIKDLKISYPVAVDNNDEIWDAFKNEYWPAHYLIDVDGRIRYHHFGEGSYEQTEEMIQKLLNDRSELVSKSSLGAGVQAQRKSKEAISHETYLGTKRGVGYRAKTKASQLALHQWTLQGKWSLRERESRLISGRGILSYRFKAQDVHLVLGSTTTKKIRFRVLIDGKIPGELRGIDIDENGEGSVDNHRLYQLIRMPASGEHLFQIEFFDAGVEAFAFTFG